MRSLQNRMSVDTGMNVTALASFSVDPTLHKHAPERTRRSFSNLSAQLAQLPGLSSCGVAQLPLLAQSGSYNTVHVQGQEPKSPDDHTTVWNAFLPGAFTALRASLLEGRDFTDRDVPGAPVVAIVNETFAREFARGEHLVGLHAGCLEKGEAPLEIIGEIKDTTDSSLDQKPGPAFYTALLQVDLLFGATFYVRTNAILGDPLAVIPAVRRTLRG